MRAHSDIRWRAQASRMRSRGQWAFVVGAIGLLGCIVGLVQFLLYGHVSIRPGHDPVLGRSAAEMLLFLLVISVAFALYGLAMVHRARRILER